MRRSEKSSLRTSKRIRKNPEGPGYIISNKSIPFCTHCNRHGCKTEYEKYDHPVRGKKSLKKCKQGGKGAKWARD